MLLQHSLIYLLNGILELRKLIPPNHQIAEHEVFNDIFEK